MDLRKQLDEEQCIAWGVYSEDWTSWGITAEKADATFLLRTYEDYGRARDFAESFSPHAVPLQRVVPTTSACFDKPTWRKAFQYGVPEIRAKFPGVSIESVTIRHQSGATIEACHSDAIFTFQGKSTISQNNEGIDRLLLDLRPRYAQIRTEGKTVEVFAEAHLFSTCEDDPLSSWGQHIQSCFLYDKRFVRQSRPVFCTLSYGRVFLRVKSQV